MISDTFTHYLYYLSSKPLMKSLTHDIPSSFISSFILHYPQHSHSSFPITYTVTTLSSHPTLTWRAMRTGMISAILDSPSILREERQRVKRTVSPRHTRSSAPSVHLLMLRWHTRDIGLRNAEKIWYWGERNMWGMSKSMCECKIPRQNTFPYIS